MSIQQSLPSSKILTLEDSSSSSVTSPKQLPIKVSLPTLAPSSSPLPQPAPLEELNAALLKLKQALESATGSTDAEERVAKCILEVKEKIPKEEIDFSQYADYDTNRYYELFRYCANKLFYCYLPECQETFRLLGRFTNKVTEAVQKPKAKKYDRYGLDFGTCYGENVAHLRQSTPIADEETERIGRFFQAAYKINNKYEDEQDPREIGKFVLDHPEEYLFLIQKAARIIYPKGKEADFINDVKHDKAPLPRMAIERLLGKLAMSTQKELCNITLKIMDERQRKKDRSTEIFEQLKRSVSDAEKFAKLKMEYDAVEKEQRDLDIQIDSYISQHRLLKMVIEGCQKRQSDRGNFPEKMLKYHGIRKGNVILEKTPIKELVEKIKALPDKKGTFDLHLFFTGDVDHGILLSLDPPFFGDINDTCHITGKKKIRRFSTLDELLDFLPQYLQVYPELQAAELIRYEKIAPTAPLKAGTTR